MIAWGEDTTDADRAWIFGLLYRLLAGVACFAHATLAPQVLTWAGSRGIVPVRLRLAAARRDYGAAAAAARFPTLHWLTGTGDLALVATSVVGAAAAAWAGLFGGAAAAPLMLLSYACYLSNGFAVNAYFPWDELLLEMSFLAALLPAPLPLLGGGVALSAAPLPALAFCFRLLLWRLMFGFGKLKFTGTTWKDSDYLKGFLVSMPLPNVPGRLGHHMPLALHQFSVLFLFVSEIPVPFLALAWGRARQAAALFTVVLQLGIIGSGSFGHFNVLTAVLAVSCADASGGLFDAVPAWDAHAVAVHAVLLALAPLVLLAVPFNSWCNHSFAYWPTLQGLPGLAYFRAMRPFRLVHAYGVFPPGSFPGARHVPVFEGSDDGAVWREYEYRYQTCRETSRPRHAAPYHPRFDMGVFYDSWGVARSTMHHPLLSGDPYLFSPSSALGDCTAGVAQRLLEGGAPVAREFAVNPFPDPARPPRFVRARFYLFRPTSNARALRDGVWWERTYLGPHMPAARRDPTFWARFCPDPTQFHWDQAVWRRRSPAVRDLAEAAAAAGGVSAALVAAAPRLRPVADAAAADAAGDTLGEAQVRRFWDELVPRVREFLDASGGEPEWDGVPALVERLRGEFSRGELHAFGRVLAGVTAAVLHRVAPSFEARILPAEGAARPFEYIRRQHGLDGAAPVPPSKPYHAFAFPLPSLYHAGFFAHQLVLDGEEAVNAAIREPLGAAAVRRAFEVGRQLEAAEEAAGGARTGRGMTCALLWAVFNYDQVGLVARKTRILERIQPFNGRHEVAISGFFRVAPWMARELLFPALDGVRDAEGDEPWDAERVPRWQHPGIGWHFDGFDELAYRKGDPAPPAAKAKVEAKAGAARKRSRRAD